MVETDVLSVTLVRICHDSRDTMDLESLSTLLLAGCTPSLSQKQNGSGGDREGTGRGCRAVCRGLWDARRREHVGMNDLLFPILQPGLVPSPVTTWGRAVLPPHSFHSQRTPPPCLQLQPLPPFQKFSRLTSHSETRL